MGDRRSSRQADVIGGDSGEGMGMDMDMHGYVCKYASFLRAYAGRGK
jgi:hypothetical protein